MPGHPEPDPLLCFWFFLVAGYETDKLQKFSQIFSQDDARPEAEGEASDGGLRGVRAEVGQSR